MVDNGDEWLGDEDEEDYLPFLGYDDYDIEDACINCGAHAFEECTLCGLPLCPMCFECSGGVCDRHR